jgi:cell fate (sporulation/competence/biofilm development) regulator YlbF (YheA/YmcA/DUF963 family)
MATLTDSQALSGLMQKTLELCQAILNEPNVGSIRQRIDAFMADEPSRTQYEEVVNKSQTLQQKQQMALPLTGDEISDFEGRRDALMKNPLARDFMDAQEEMHDLQHTIQKYVAKTLELGRLPTPEEATGGACGHGCGCGH